jgi:hypothetical protein
MGKIRLRHGDSEIELEGDEVFIERQLADFYSRFKIDARKQGEQPKLLTSTSGGETEHHNGKAPTPAEYLKTLGDANLAPLKQLLALGRFLEEHRKKREFKPKDVNAVAREAKLPKDFHRQYFSDAVARGLLRLDSGNYSLTATAENFLVSNTSGSAPRKVRASQKQPVKGGTQKARAKSIEIEKFDPHKNAQAPSLEEFLSTKKPGASAGQRLLVIGYYITKVKGAPSFSEGNIDYAYRILKLTGRPAFLRQILINNKNNNDWFDPAADKVRWVLTRTGEIFVEEKLPQSVDAQP